MLSLARNKQIKKLPKNDLCKNFTMATIHCTNNCEQEGWLPFGYPHREGTKTEMVIPLYLGAGHSSDVQLVD